MSEDACINGKVKNLDGRIYRVEILTTNSSIQNTFWSFSKILLAGTSSGLFLHILLSFASVELES